MGSFLSFLKCCIPSCLDSVDHEVKRKMGRCPTCSNVVIDDDIKKGKLSFRDVAS